MKKRIWSLFVVFSIIASSLVMPISVSADATDDVRLSVDFTDGAAASWTQANTAYSATATYYKDTGVGNYIRLSDNNAVNSIKTGVVSPSFTAITDVAVMDFDVRSYGAGGIGNGVIGVKPINGSVTDAEYAFGFRSHKSSSSPSIAYGVGGSKYTAVSNAPTSKHDTWYHYTVIFDFINAKTKFIITDRSTGTSFTNEISGVTVPSMTAVEIFLSQPTNYCQTGFAVDVANLQIYRPNPTTINLTAKNNITEQFIGSSDISIQYTAIGLHDIIYKTNSGATENKATGNFDVLGNIDFTIANENGEDISVNGLTVDNSGLVTLSPTVSEGTYYIKASSPTASKMLPLKLKLAKDANSVKIDGSEVVSISDTDKTYKYSATPKYDGTAIPERSTTWTIISGNDKGVSIDASTGILTVPTTAMAGKITIQAVLNIEANQVTENVLDTFDITIYDSSIADEKYSVGGIFLENGVIDLTSAKSITGVILSVKDIVLTDNYSLILKSYDKNNYLANEKSFLIDSSSIKVGVQWFNVDFKLDEASFVKAYIKNSEGIVISSEVKEFTKGSYKNIPLVSDWITGAKSGLGMGTGVINPTNVPTGINPSLVKTSTSNVNYTYDSNYPKITTDNMLWYKTGAYNESSTIYDRDGADWEKQALPIGNGYMGGMIFGMPGKDHIQFNEETFWAGGYKGTQSSNASAWSSYVTKWKNGSDFTSSAIQAAVGLNSSMSEGINGYMNAGNIFVDFGLPSGTTVNNYYRDLNLDEGVAHVQYEYNGVTYKREYFASYPDEVMVFRYSADTNNSLNFTVNPVSAHPGDITVSNGEITIVGKLKDSEPYSSGGNAAWACESDLEYCTKVKVITDGGEAIDGYGNVKVENANSVTIIVTATTDYDANQFVTNSDGSATVANKQYKSPLGVQYAIDKATARIANTNDATYEQIKAKHMQDYQNLFGRVSFSLTDENEICQIPTDTLRASYGSVVNATYTGDDESLPSTITKTSDSAYNSLDKHLEELFYNFGRYMLMSSSRETSLPANLQGKWNQSVAEIWGSCYCININMEMNYWMAGGANLFESGKSLVDWFESQIPAGRITAKNGYGIVPKDADGNISDKDRDDVFIMHTKQAINGTTDMTGSASIQSPGNTAFMMQNLWDLYLTSGDTQYLADKIYPVMRKSANFYAQYMNQFKITTTDIENYPDGYYYTSGASRSPENGPYELGVKYDLQLIAGLFDYCIEAADILGIDEDKIAQWQEIRNHMQMPVEIGTDGQVKEWASETSYNKDANGNQLGVQYHRHISHLVGLYPGTLISRDTPQWLNGAKIVLENRGDNGKGWSCSFKVLLRARTLDGDGALEMLRFQLGQKVYGNLFDFHTPFQIDGNLGSTAAIMEMLMQSQTGPIYLLPALPTAWDHGSIGGIKAKNGASVDINWDGNKLSSAKITPVKDGDLQLGYDIENKNLKVTDDNGKVVILASNNSVYTLKNAVKEMTYTVTATDEEPTEIKQDYEVKSVEAVGDKYNVVVTKNNSINSTGNIMFVATYNENNEMTSVEIVDLSESVVGDNQYNVSLNSEGSIRVFIWNDMSTIKPLTVNK